MVCGAQQMTTLFFRSEAQNLSLEVTRRRTPRSRSDEVASDEEKDAVTSGHGQSFEGGEKEAFRYICLLEQKVLAVTKFFRLQSVGMLSCFPNAVQSCYTSLSLIRGEMASPCGLN